VIRALSKPVVHCAIYTRKSSDENLDLDFNSLDAQRESGEAYIASQQHEGWVCLPDRYDDGGYSGGNTERPALKRLLADVEAGTIDCVVIYKYDRLSRSLLDFTRMMELLDTHHVALVAVTQPINTSTSTGRLMLNILSSFAQFERELVSERTRDKIAAARRKGQWAGGHPVLGYDIVRGPGGGKLVVNEDEAAIVRQIFDLYLDHKALLPVVNVLGSRGRGWRTKAWTTSKGKDRGGRAFDKNSLYKLLTNPILVGKITHKDKVYDGLHPRIVDEKVFNQVQQVLARNGRNGGADVRNKYGALLKGLLRCKPCGCAMAHSYSSKGATRYRYYVCCHAQKKGWKSCPSPSVPAEQIEQFVVEQIRAIGQDPRMLRETIAEAMTQTHEDLKKLTAEQSALRRQHRRDAGELAKVAATVGGNGHAAARLADLNDRISTSEQRLDQVAREIEALQAGAIDQREAAEALRQFDPVRNQLAPREQARLLQLLVQRVEYDGAAGTVAITFHPEGFHAVAAAAEDHATEEVAA